jgi:mannose-6-phosphate isomerase-like protein (cupin superfamily)
VKNQPEEVNTEYLFFEDTMKKTVIFSLAIFLAATLGYAQAPRGGGQPTGREDSLDPSPIDLAKDPNVGMFLNDYRNSKPRPMYGKLMFHDILTKLEGPDPQHPTKRGAVLTAITAISYATLDPGATATGKEEAGQRQIFYTSAGDGQLTVNGKSYDVKDGIGFILTPEFDFKLTNTGKVPVGMYVRTEPIPAGTPSNPNVVVSNRFDNDRRIGAHWVHTCNGGPGGMSLCTIAPFTMPQPHSHPGEECWIMVKGESILSLGKTLQKMEPGQAYKIPPTGLAAHSNINFGSEPVEMIFMGPAGNGGGGRGGRGGGAQPAAGETVATLTPPATAPAAAPARGGAGGGTDFARLDNAGIVKNQEHDVDMFMNDWETGYPRIAHGNIYTRDMLTAAEGSDPLHPVRKGAVLTNATAVSYGMLEPNSSAHHVDGELKGVQETFIVHSGTGYIVSGSQKVDLSKDMAFIITPDLDFRLTATGDKYMTFYVVSEKIPAGVTPKNTLQVVDDRSKPQTANAWVDRERPLITKSEGLLQYSALTQVEQPPMTMARPYSDNADTEEIWIATDNDISMLFGKELRRIPAGTAYRVPSTGITAHANINVTDKPAQFIYMVK